MQKLSITGLAGRPRLRPGSRRCARPSGGKDFKEPSLAVDVHRTLALATATLQWLNNPGEHALVIKPRRAARILRQMGLDRRPMLN